MANIRIDLDHEPYDGERIIFKAPCDASSVTGLIFYYSDTSMEFTLCDAHGEDVGNIDDVFADEALVTVILEIENETCKAFIQNADTNAYLEGKFDTKADNTTVEDLGNAIVFDGWNQLLQNGKPDSVDGWSGGNGGQISYASNRIVVTYSSANNNPYTYRNLENSIPSGHKVLISCDVDWGGTSTSVTQAYIGLITQSFTNWHTITVSSKINHIEGIVTLTGDVNRVIVQNYSTNTVIGDNFKTYNIQVIDLTAIFGSGNEPSTVAEFRKMYAEDYYEYCPIGGWHSNRNYIDNPFFTINQRGATSGSMVGGLYVTVDRWKTNYGSTAGTWSLSNGVFTISASGGSRQQLQQLFEHPEYLDGKTLTASLMLSDGSIVSGTINRANGTNQYFWGNSSTGILLDSNNGFEIRTDSTISFKSVKLELGSKSTLAQDAPPNYVEELAKCQRYYVRIGGCAFPQYGVFMGESSTSAYGQIELPVPMRATPVMTYASSYLTLWDGSNSTAKSVSAMSVDSNVQLPTNPKSAGLQINASGITIGKVYILEHRGYSSGYIAFSADL